jgi:hypothetical protein
MADINTCTPHGPAEIDAEELETALVMRLKALKINQCLGSRRGMADDYGRLATLHGLLGELERALSMLEQAVEIETFLGRQETLPDAFHHLGEIFLAHGSFDGAEKL